MTLAWSDLPATVRERALQLARAGQAHPDPAVGRAAVEWHRRRYRRAKAFGRVTTAVGVAAIGFLVAALQTEGVVLVMVGVALAFCTLLLDAVALELHRHTQALGWLAAANLRPTLGLASDAVALPLTVRSTAHHAPTSLPTIVTAVAMFAMLAACMPFFGDLPALVTYVLIGLLGLFLMWVLAFSLGGVFRRPLVVMDEHRLDMPALEVTLGWDEVEAIALTAPHVVGWWVGKPVGFAVRPRTPVGSRFVRAVMRRQQGWLFLVDWQMDTPPEVVVATALRLHTAFCRGRMADSGA